MKTTINKQPIDNDPVPKNLRWLFSNELFVILCTIYVFLAILIVGWLLR